MDFKKMEPAGADKDTPYPEKELDVPAASDNAVAPSSADSAIALVVASTLEKAINQEPLKEKQKKIAYEFGLNALFNPERLHPSVEFLIYWRDVEKSGMVFGTGLIALMAFAQFSTISLLSSLLLVAMLGCFAVRVYASVMQVADISEEGDQFKEYLELDLTLSPERVQHLTVVAVDHFNYFIAQLRSLFLFEDVYESVNFGLTLGSLTILGGMFNGMTLIILGRFGTKSHAPLMSN